MIGQVAAEPRPVDCPGCGAPAVRVEVCGEVVLADRAEVLPPMPCPSCSGSRVPRPCGLCGGTRRIGGSFPGPGEAVVLKETGAARAWPGRDRRPGEAVHRLHVCSAGASEAA